MMAESTGIGGTCWMDEARAYGAAGRGDGPVAAAGFRELDPAELEDIEGGFLFLAGFAAGVILGAALSKC
jgi:hypothetical protein